MARTTLKVEKKKFMSLRELTSEMGIKQRSWFRDLHSPDPTIYQWSREGLPKLQEKKVKIIIKKRASALSKIKLTGEVELGAIIKEFGINESWLAKQLNISRQALNRHRQRGVGPERLSRIEAILRSSGKEALQKIDSIR